MRLSTLLLMPPKPSVADHSHSIACVRKMARAGPAHKHKRGTKSPASFGCAQMMPPKPRAQILGNTEHLHRAAAGPSHPHGIREAELLDNSFVCGLGCESPILED